MKREKRFKLCQFSLNKVHVEELKDISQKRCLSLSDIVRRALDMYFDDFKEKEYRYNESKKVE